MRIRGVAPILTLLALAVAACGGGSSQIAVEDAFSFVPATDTTAAYFTVTNDGDADDVLVSATAEGFGRVELHESVITDGVAQMVEQADGVAIPAGETVTLEQGGLHVMLMQPENTLAAGDEIAMTLVFEEAGEVEVTATVRERGADDAPPMSQMEHDDMDGGDAVDDADGAAAEESTEG